MRRVRVKGVPGRGKGPHRGEERGMSEGLTACLGQPDRSMVSEERRLQREAEAGHLRIRSGCGAKCSGETLAGLGGT